MTGEGEEQEKSKPRKEKARVSEDRELTEKRKGSSDRLFVLEIDLNWMKVWMNPGYMR